MREKQTKRERERQRDTEKEKMKMHAQGAWWRSENVGISSVYSVCHMDLRG